MVIHLDELKPSEAGATAFYGPRNEATFFSIAGQQADKTDEKTWSIWFGQKGGFDVLKERAQFVNKFLSQPNAYQQHDFKVPTL